MIVAIGSRSVPKISAVTRAFSKYPELWANEEEKLEYIIMPKKDVEVGPVSAWKGQEKDDFSGVSCNPLTLSETINGAKNRARNAFEHAKEAARHMQLWCRNRSRYVSSTRSRNRIHGCKHMCYI